MSAIGFEIEKFRLSNDRFPKSLAELDPKAIEGIDIDRFSGNPLGYKLTPKGYVLYSVGADKVDSTLDANGNLIELAGGVVVDDVVLRVERK